jgi:thymidylate synthase (FAD)
MKAVYENHYLTDRDVANFARHSFADLADNFTEAQNNNLIKFLARGMKTSDWDGLIAKMLFGLHESSAQDLARYLRKIPCHWVPFGHPHISLRMSAPVPIRTQCFKHKIGFVESEESRRYIKSRPVLFIPDQFRAVAEDVKQGSGGTHSGSTFWRDTYISQCNHMIDLYMEMIDEGICPEQARLVLPQGVEVNWVWTGSLYAFAMAYNARSEAHAQKEVQDLFAEVDQIIAPLFPVSWAALTE